jgi:hypothetical protein
VGCRFLLLIKPLILFWKIFQTSLVDYVKSGTVCTLYSGTKNKTDTLFVAFLLSIYIP